MSRSTLRLFFLTFAIYAGAQTGNDFTARYGYPDAERFIVRPGIVMTAKYSDDLAACEMFIVPESSLEQRNDNQAMAVDTASKIIDELIPLSERGILLNHMIEAMGAAEFQVAEYQNVTISRNFLRSLPANHDQTSAAIIRKDRPCKPATVSQAFVPTIELNAADLHARYNVPTAQRFMVRPSITLMVSYGADQAACRMTVDVAHSIIPREEPDKYMRPEVVTEIIDEILPAAARGQLVSGLVTKSGCNEIETDDYQHWIVNRFRHKCNLPSPEIEGAATITFKSSACGNARNQASPNF